MVGDPGPQVRWTVTSENVIILLKINSSSTS